MESYQRSIQSLAQYSSPVKAAQGEETQLSSPDKAPKEQATGEEKDNEEGAKGDAATGDDEIKKAEEAHAEGDAEDEDNGLPTKLLKSRFEKLLHLLVHGPPAPK